MKTTKGRNGTRQTTEERILLPVEWSDSPSKTEKSEQNGKEEEEERRKKVFVVVVTTNFVRICSSTGFFGFFIL